MKYLETFVRGVAVLLDTKIVRVQGRFFMLCTLVLVAGCSSSVPSLNQYLLRSDVAGQFTVTQQKAVTGFGVIVVAPYIDGLGLVLETPDGEVRAARDHQWAEPLRDSLRMFMVQEVSVQIGQRVRLQNSGESDWRWRIDLRIDELHGTAEGEARLAAYWHIFDTQERRVISENGFVETQAIKADGYGALVAAEKQLLGQLARAIAASL